MADPRVELRNVKEELSHVEQQIEQLLGRQQELLAKQKQLEEDIRNQHLSVASHTDDWNSTGYKWSQEIDEIKKSVFSIREFRPLQLETMNATLSGKDCILIMPTGGGKSLCFQLPALLSKGVTLVVSPLVSLMEDQLLSLQQYKVEASLLNASSSKPDIKRIHDAMTDLKSDMKLLYCTPEKLAKSKRFMNKLEKMYDLGRFCRLVIDEVHCCSQWGHDFRPDYKFLGVMKRQFPGVPILGLTATASNSVVNDVKKILNIPQSLLFRANFNRENLYYEVKTKPSKQKDTYEEISNIIRTRFKDQSGIVYCFSRKDAEDVTRELQIRGIKAGCYHADVHPDARSCVHRKWLSNQIQVVVATVAFGMGIDKPDVRFVLHHSISKSMENYYQESGRAGRDGAPATCILLTSFADTFRQSTMVFTEQTGLEKLYNMVTYAFELSKCRRVLIGHHFGEQFDSSRCKEMCDHCDTKNSGGKSKKNVTQYCKDLLTILKHAYSTQQRVTGLKLLDAWMGKGAATLRVASVKPPLLPRNACESVLLYMLIHGYIREDFHFTAYSTISYLVAGPKADLLFINGKTIEVDLPVAAKSAPLPRVTRCATAPATVATSVEGKDKANNKLCIVNSVKSLFRSPVLGESEKTPTENKLTNNCSTSDFRQSVRKRKPVIESDSDSDLDFGKDSSIKKVRKFDGPIECLIVDSDSDTE